nr:hypothetical protein [Tanacetum cinerariifolium]
MINPRLRRNKEGEPDLPVPVPESLHEQTDEELTKTDIKRIDADDQAIQTIRLGLPEDVYAAVDSYIGEQEKKAKLFNEWEKFTYTDGESIESYYYQFMQLMNDLKRNKHFPENIASNLKFLNNLQPEWKRHVTIVHQTKNLHEADFTQIYDFLKMNQKEDQQIHNVRGNDGNQFRQYVGQVAQNQQGFNAWQNGIANQSETGNVVAARAEGTGIGNQARCYNCRGLGHVARNCTARPRRRDAAYLQTQLLIAQKEEAEIQLQAKELDFMAAVGDLDEIKEVNANCILMANLQQASTSGTQHDRALVYDIDGSAENDNHVTSVAPSMVHSRGIVETSSAPNEDIHAHQEIVYRNLVGQVSQLYGDAIDGLCLSLKVLQVLSNLHYLFSGFIDYFWSLKLNISNFGPANRKILPMIIDIGTPCRETISLMYNLCKSFHTICRSGGDEMSEFGSKNRPPMLNKENNVPWSSRLLRYAKSRPNGKLIYNSIINGPYVRRTIPEPGDSNREVPVNETFHVQTDDELTEKELKQIEADDQAIQTILLGLPEDIYAAVDGCEIAQQIWLRVQQMMKGSDIGIQ